MKKLKLPTIRLPSINFTLPERNIDLSKEVKKLKRLAMNAGRGSDFFRENYLKIFRQLERGEFFPLSLEIPKQIYIYLTIALQKELKESMAEQINFEPPLLEQFAKVRSPMSHLSLMMLIQLYFERFDGLTKSSENFDYLCQFLRHQVKLLNKFRQRKENELARSDLARYAEQAEWLFNRQAPLNIVKFAHQKQQDFTYTLQDLGIAAFRNGRLLHISQNIYYIETLKTIPLGKPHKILSEVTKKDIIQVQYNKSYWIGHKVIEILIDRTINEGGDLSEYWQSVILDIAGDPRIASTKMDTWWRPLGEKRIQQMRSWLSRYDLKLFLELLEQSAKDLGNEDMERMFAGRKRFLEALFDNDFIQHSRLFFTKDALDYLRRHYSNGNRFSAYATVKGESSVIYLQLKNGWHLIEGTHNFKLRYFDEIPSRSKITHYNYRNFERNELASDLENYYLSEFHQEMDSTPHDAYGNWKVKLLKWLEKTDVNLPVDSVLNKDEYLKWLRY
ncbi:EH signature domain-containing protein [Rodentibacter trehalosifermentans]|uniref:Zorya protein ZorC EH domain-containing protein n=1 Tax=Rodentibacter trehalosifermentans TaxID=1908263 RepID=A0A1V3IQ87_9PAST|nr:EH signature domain-containing protein [Rodentibacter trehalosifermentans]OOF44418.1 hypothetical protein BKK51_08995 [Rodentibacter trehalosifermentans]OOF45318.1 hypothetical protein BKK52_12680 [Rodentibacter trehalosifermentans]OOF53956.1 hypothetical protein BKK53_00055 [Rodentibacter trehalosifermentans]